MTSSPAADGQDGSRLRRRDRDLAEPSRIRLVDYVGESWLELSRRPIRTLLTGLGVALGIAAVVVTQGLVTTVRFQVSDEFDATLATQVEVRLRSADDPFAGSSGVGDDLNGSTFPPDAEAIDRAERLSGVEGIAVLRDSERPVPVALSQVQDRTAISEAATIHGINAAGLDALGATVTGTTWSSWHDATGQRVALLGRRTADAFGAQELRPGDQIYLDGIAYTLLGVIEDGGRVAGLANGVTIPATATDLYAMSPDRDRVLAVTVPGAAKDVEAVLPVALAPAAPDRYIAYTPAQSGDLRRAVDAQLQTLALALGAVVVGLGVVSIGNATLTSVLQRTNEIGIRRALGARPRHVGLHVILDAALTGAAGGLVGVSLGLSTTLAVAANQGWQPILDPSVPLLALAAGVLVGALAGLYPARVASRLEPTEALRRE